MSTGGWEQHEWSLCNLYNKQLTLLVNQSNRFDSPRLKFINLLSTSSRPTELILPTLLPGDEGEPEDQLRALGRVGHRRQEGPRQELYAQKRLVQFSVPFTKFQEL